MNFTLTDEQLMLVDRVKTWFKNYESGLHLGEHPQWFCYSGKAGCGKTTVAYAIIEELHLENSYVASAFVGKAVMRLQQSGLVARTIHSLIYNVLFIDEPYEKDGVIKMRKKMIFQLKEKLDDNIRLIIIDEGTMVNDAMMKEILSFGKPILIMGDHNQLPPVYGKSSMMNNPDFILTKIMRQKENDPIVILANMILQGIPLIEGNYGKSKVTRYYELDSKFLTDYDQAICATNRKRDLINNFVRENLLGYDSKAPQIGDRIVCRQNDWDLALQGFNLTNGMSGIITDIDRSYLAKGYYLIDFKPDLFNDTYFEKYDPDELIFHGLEMDYEYIQSDYEQRKDFGLCQHQKFEYAYAITCYTAQGSEWDRGLYLHSFFVNSNLTKATAYTAVTRFKKSVHIVLGNYRGG